MSWTGTDGGDPNEGANRSQTYDGVSLNIARSTTAPRNVSSQGSYLVVRTQLPAVDTHY